MTISEDKPKIAIMVWQDAWSDERRVLADDLYYTRDVFITEVGWVMHDNEERIVLCREYSDHVTHDERMFSSCIAVPRGMVREVIYLDAE